MQRSLALHDPGEGIHEAEVIEILVSEGERVVTGQEVAVVETDKAEFEIEAPFGGTVVKVAVSPGDTVRVGEELMTLDDTGEVAEAPLTGARLPPKPPIDELVEQPAAVAGTPSPEPEARAPAPELAGAEKPSRERGPVPASPATRRIAKQLGVDLHEVPASGEQGRVLTGDVLAFAECRSALIGERQPAPQAAEAGARFDFERFGPVERQPLRSIRRTTARRMAESWKVIPHVTHNDVADITELEAFRVRHAESIAAAGGRLTLTVLALKATVAALKRWPRFNASLDADKEELALKLYYHIGVALDTERGLIVPTIRDVDQKSLAELSVELHQLVERVRRNEIHREELLGGSFTVTNIGSLGGTSFTPIIDYPEVAILGLARARMVPVVRGSLDQSQIVPRLMLPLTLTFDHRVNDGADAARFMNMVIGLLSDVERLALEG